MKRKKKRSVYKMSRIKTRLVKSRVPKPLLPLFNHIIKLADSSHKNGYAKRAGIELAHARKLAK